MVKRVTVSVPDELYEKMKEWGESINFSKEFQRHMGTLIRQKEKIKNLVNGDEQMQKIVERLRKEKIEAMGDPDEDGFDEGYELAEDMHYPDLQELRKWDPDKGLPRIEGLEDFFDEFFREIFSNYEYLDRVAWDRRNQHEYNQRFFEAFKKGIEAFWDKVKELI